MLKDFQKDIFDKNKTLKRGEYVVILDKGESIINSLQRLITDLNVHGFFIGLGAIKDPVVAYYDISSKTYIKKEFKGEFELVSLIGNLGMDESGNPIVHAHVAFADKDYKLYGGHLIDGKVAVTLELLVITVDSITRKLVDEFGLKLIRGAT